MDKIYLYNRDGATMWLDRNGVESDLWTLKVDDKHTYCLEYMRVIRDGKDGPIKAVDPSGGPFISIADEFEDVVHKQFKIIEIIDSLTFRMSERNNN